jgi:hypothetical protein
VANSYPYGRGTPETSIAEDLFADFVEAGRQRMLEVGDPRARRLPSDITPELKGERPLGPEGEQPPNGRAMTLPGAGLEGEAFRSAIRTATAPGAAARETAMDSQAPGGRASRLPRVEANFVGPPNQAELPESIRQGSSQSTGDPWGVDVSQSGMAQNERARQAIEGRYINRLQEIAAAREASGGTPQEQDLRARRIDAEATAITPPPRPLAGEGGAFQVGPDRTIRNAPQRPPASMAQLQAAIFDRVRVAGQGLAAAYAKGDKAQVAEATAAYERILRESELQLSSLAGRPITGSRQGTLDIGVGAPDLGSTP